MAKSDFVLYCPEGRGKMKLLYARLSSLLFKMARVAFLENGHCGGSLQAELHLIVVQAGSHRLEQCNTWIEATQKSRLGKAPLE